MPVIAVETEPNTASLQIPVIEGKAWTWNGWTVPGPDAAPAIGKA